MTYKYRVSLEGIKGFFRVYSVNGAVSLYSFHKQLRSDLEFPVDQPILFKAMDEEKNVVARYALVDLGFKTVDEVSVGDTVKAGITSFVYFYDIASRKSVIITLEGEEKEETGKIVLTESKGPLPIAFEQGYVAFEDMPQEKRKLPSDDGEDEPDDDDDLAGDKEGEDEEGEEEELVYEEE